MGYVEDLRNIVGHRPLILVGAVVIIINDEQGILLQKRKASNGAWGIPGGLMELGESTEETAKREVYEETGLIVENLNLIDVFSGPNNFIIAKNGDEFFTVTIAYYTKSYTGVLNVNLEESFECKYFQLEELPEVIVKSHKNIIDKYIILMRKKG